MRDKESVLEIGVRERNYDEKGCEERDYSSDKDFSEKYFFNSSVVNTLVNDCSLKCLSLDQIGIFNSSASARKGASFLCEINDSAFSKNSFLTGLKLIINGNKSNISETSSKERFVILQILADSLDNSSRSSSTENKESLFSTMNFLMNESLLNKKYAMLVSNTIFIYLKRDLIRLYILSLDSSSIFKDNSSVISLSVNSRDNFSNASIFLARLVNSSLAKTDQFTQRNLESLFLTSSSTANVTLAIIFFLFLLILLIFQVL